MSIKYAKTHEWAELRDDGRVYIGISDYAQNALGDIVYVDLPIMRGLETGEVFGSVESVKAVSDLCTPVGGMIAEINTELADSPELLNEDFTNWIIAVTPSDPAELDGLMDEAEYAEYCNGL
jgi:glycine cleavage system H protein